MCYYYSSTPVIELLEQLKWPLNSFVGISVSVHLSVTSQTHTHNFVNGVKTDGWIDCCFLWLQAVGKR